MLSFNIKLSKSRKNKLHEQMVLAEAKGDYNAMKRFIGIMMFLEKIPLSQISDYLNVYVDTVRKWVKRFIVYGVKILYSRKSSGRPSKLTKKQKKELSAIIEKGPEAAGFPGGCWRSPMIAHLIEVKFKKSYSVKYVSQLLRNMGFSYQKAKFVLDKKDELLRKDWMENKWPEIMKLADKKNSYVLFGDECSFPQWGSLSYTWAKKGKQPTVKTCGKRKGYKIFGLIDYFTGRFFSKGIDGKLNAESYVAFIKEVLACTRKHIILIQDGAPYHRSSLVKNFFEQNKSRITVYDLPSYSPDYNPIEMLWKKIKQHGTHLVYFPTFDDLINKVNNTLIEFENAPDEVLSLFGLYTEKAA